MQRTFFHLTLATVFMLSACQSQPEAPTVDFDQIYQYSTIKALLEGHYDGQLTFEELAAHGDFGLGTFNALDGEMIALDGTFYQVKASGEVDTVALDMRTPFAVMTHFKADTTVTLNGDINYIQVRELLDQVIPGENLFYAIRIEGEFGEMKVRSVPRQEPPYRPLAEVTDEQSMYGYSRTVGTMVGFRSPSYTEEITVPGYHMHYLSDDRQKGGHVLYFESIRATVHIDFLPNLHMALPTDDTFHQLNLREDRSEELNKVETLDD